MTKTVFRVLGVVASVVVGSAASAADSTPAVEWKVSNGGNGHWYASTTLEASWNTTRIIANTLGADLATITSLEESNFLCNTVLRTGTGNASAFWFGLKRGQNNNWIWVTGESFAYQNWSAGNPGDIEDSGWVFGANHPTSGVGCQWNDAEGNSGIHNYSGLIEYSADCNGDGSVDYGQIQSGELADTNHNGVPDVCELHITYVQPISGSASGGTPVNINGMNFPTTVSVLFGGVAATDVVVVSSTVITAVTPVGVPGMTVVTVNGVGGEAFYYRSNCQSDLDGSGGVDSSDLGILLLDFGSCGDSAAVAPQPEPLILQSVETPTPVLNKK